jgi:hypothetical protein
MAKPSEFFEPGTPKPIGRGPRGSGSYPARAIEAFLESGKERANLKDPNKAQQIRNHLSKNRDVASKVGLAEANIGRKEHTAQLYRR